MKRFTIAGLMVVVLICGVGLASLRDTSEFWSGILLSITLLLLGFAIAGVAYRREGQRAFWLGFAVFGWGYLTITQGPWFADQIEPRLPTTHALGYLHAQANPGQVRAQPWTRILATQMSGGPTFPESSRMLRSGGLIGVASTSEAGQAVNYYLAAENSVAQFTRAGHYLFTLLIAVLGGWTFRRFHATNRHDVH